MWVPMPKSTPPALPPRPRLDHGRDERRVPPPRRAGMTDLADAADEAEGALAVLGVVDPLRSTGAPTPTDRTKRGADGGDADSAALERQALAEEEDHDEDDRRDDRDQPGVLEEPHRRSPQPFIV